MSQILKNMSVSAFAESMLENVEKAITANPGATFNIAVDAYALRHLLTMFLRIHREKPEWIVEHLDKTH